MKRSTIRLLVLLSALYFAVLFLARGFVPSSIPFPLYFLVAPLLMVVLFLVSDLSARATVPSDTPMKPKSERKLAWDVQRLTRQIEVGSRASGEYYNSVLLERLRGVLVEKVCLETGMERERVKNVLKNKILGPALLRDRELYRLLYTGAPVPGPGRTRLLEEALAGIEAWKP